MTKQDYIKLANVISEKTVSGIIETIRKVELLDALCELLKSDNPRFNEETFRKACEY